MKKFNLEPIYERFLFVQNWIKKLNENNGYSKIFLKYQGNSNLDMETEIKGVLFLGQFKWKNMNYDK